MKLGIDFDDTAFWTYMLKSVYIAQTQRDWRDLYIVSYTKDLVFMGMDSLAAREEAERYVNSLPIIPPWHADRNNLVPIIGEAAYNLLSSAVHRQTDIELPLKPGFREGLEAMVNEDGNEVFLVTSRREEDFRLALEVLEKNDVYWLFRGFHQFGRNESKVPACVGLGLSGLVDDELRFLAGPAPEGFVKVLVGAQISQYDKEAYLVKNPPFIRAIAQAGIDVGKFLDMLARAGESQRTSITRLGDGDLVPFIDSIGKAENIIYAPRFNYARHAFNPGK